MVHCYHGFLLNKLMQNTSEENIKIQQIAKVYQQFKEDLAETQKKRWEEITSLMKDLDETEAEKIRKQLLSE